MKNKNKLYDMFSLEQAKQNEQTKIDLNRFEGINE